MGAACAQTLSWDLGSLQAGIAELQAPAVPLLGAPAEGCCGLTGLQLSAVERLLPVYSGTGSVGFTVRTNLPVHNSPVS